MFFGRFLFVASAVTLAVVAGCAKKSNVEQKEYSAFSQNTDTTAAADTGDIFDQFYKDELSGTGADTEVPPNPSAESSFSTSSSSGNYSPKFVENGRFVVQISTIRSQRLADDLAAKLNAKGYPAYVANVENPTPALMGTYFRVRIGGFNITSEAKAFGEQILRPSGYEYWVDNRSNDHVGIQGSSFGESSPSDSYQPATSSPSSSWGSPSTSESPSTTASPETPVQSESTQSSGFESTPAPSQSTPSSGFESTPAPSESTPSSQDSTPSSSSTPGTSDWGNSGWGTESSW